MKQYECECERTNISPKAFYTYCKNAIAKKGMDIEDWITYEEWVKPSQPEEYHTVNHEDWDEPKRETIKYMPYDIHIALQNTYNFILEFEFDTEKTGHGYLYLEEYH